jgi:ribonuclease BN (tRNA processing enzyme)
MRLTKYAHSCVLVEDDNARILIDPGNLTRGFDELTGLTGILVTHQHADHVDVDRGMDAGRGTRKRAYRETKCLSAWPRVIGAPTKKRVGERSGLAEATDGWDRHVDVAERS